jgi:hypothetical protein
MYQNRPPRLLARVTDDRDKNPLPRNLVGVGVVVLVMGAILAWRESNPDAHISAGVLIAGVGVVLVLVGVVSIIWRR